MTYRIFQCPSRYFANALRQLTRNLPLRGPHSPPSGPIQRELFILWGSGSPSPGHRKVCASCGFLGLPASCRHRHTLHAAERRNNFGKKTFRCVPSAHRLHLESWKVSAKSSEVSASCSFLGVTASCRRRRTLHAANQTLEKLLEVSVLLTALHLRPGKMSEKC